METYSPLSTPKMNSTAVYEIRVAGWLDASWLDFFGKPSIALTGESDKERQTILVMQVTDQSALFGILNALNQFRLPLLYVRFLGNASSASQQPGISENGLSPPAQQGQELAKNQQ